MIPRRQHSTAPRRQPAAGCQPFRRPARRCSDLFPQGHSLIRTESFQRRARRRVRWARSAPSHRSSRPQFFSPTWTAQSQGPAAPGWPQTLPLTSVWGGEMCVPAKPHPSNTRTWVHWGGGGGVVGTVGGMYTNTQASVLTHSRRQKREAVTLR